MTRAELFGGGTGTNSQHSFHQLLFQGGRLIPVDFIAVIKGFNTQDDFINEDLLANCFAQSRTLMQGFRADSTHQIIHGNGPSNTILLEQLTPSTLGALLALYEHKVFAQSVIWGINAFDQWGVQCGKVLAQQVLTSLQSGSTREDYDSSTSGLLNSVSKMI